MNPVVTGIVGDNSDLFEAALPLFVSDTKDILDATFGKGVFWRKLPAYKPTRNDLDPLRGDTHYDFRCFPFGAESFDAEVLDPPYASRSSNKKSFVGSLYNNGQHNLNTVEDMLQFYRDGMVEAYRILRSGGFLFVKCQDEIAGGKQQRNHFSIWRDALALGFIDEDLFTLVQKGRPVMRHSYQLHARKNNSFLWVFRKK